MTSTAPPQANTHGKENVMTDQKDDLVAEARVALAIKQAAEECTKIKDAAYGDGDITFNDLYWNGWDVSAGICSESILALPHDPEALEAYVRGKVEEALDISDYDAGLLNDYGGGNVDWWMDYIRAEIARANDYWRTAIRAMMGEG